MVFKLSSTGRQMLHTFDFTDGSSPIAPLLRFKGYLYGTAEFGGSTNAGVVFRLQQ